MDCIVAGKTARQPALFGSGCGGSPFQSFVVQGIPEGVFLAEHVVQGFQNKVCFTGQDSQGIVELMGYSGG